MLKDLGWTNLEGGGDLRMALLFKIVVKGQVAGLADIVNLTLSNSRTRSAHQFKFNHLPSNTSQFKHSFIPRTIPQWNRLTESAINAETDQFCRLFIQIENCTIFQTVYNRAKIDVQDYLLNMIQKLSH